MKKIFPVRLLPISSKSIMNNFYTIEFKNVNNQRKPFSSLRNRKVLVPVLSSEDNRVSLLQLDSFDNEYAKTLTVKSVPSDEGAKAKSYQTLLYGVLGPDSKLKNTLFPSLLL